MPRGGDTSNAMIRCLCSVLLHPLHDPGVPRRCGPFARPLIGRPAQAASAAANPRAGPAARQAGRCKLSSAGTPPFGSTPAAEGMRACDWGRRWHALGFTTKRHVKAAQSRTCMPCANQPSSMSSSVVPVRLRPEHSSAIHLPAVPFRIGSCAASGRRVAAKVAASAALQVSPLTPVRPVPGLWSGLVWSGGVPGLPDCLSACPASLSCLHRAAIRPVPLHSLPEPRRSRVDSRPSSHAPSTRPLPLLRCSQTGPARSGPESLALFEPDLSWRSPDAIASGYRLPPDQPAEDADTATDRLARPAVSAAHWCNKNSALPHSQLQNPAACPLLPRPSPRSFRRRFPAAEPVPFRRAGSNQQTLPRGLFVPRGEQPAIGSRGDWA